MVPRDAVIVRADGTEGLTDLRIRHIAGLLQVLHEEAEITLGEVAEMRRNADER